MKDCVFCDLIKSSSLYRNDDFIIVDSKFPVTDNGHLLIIPKSHQEHWDLFMDSWFCGEPFVDVLLAGITILKNRGFVDYNAGFNQGELAGQTIKHIHFHLIGRVKGDVDDPRGGIRNIIPKKGNYLKDKK